MSGLHSLLTHIEEYIALQQDENFDAVQVAPATLKELRSHFDLAKKTVPPAARPPAVKPPPRAPAAQPATRTKLAPKPVQKPTPQIVLPSFQSMEEIAEHIKQCQRCPLSKTRTTTVPGEGNTHRPDIMFIGESPREQEDQTGRPLIGPAGQLFEKMIAAMGYKRDQIYLANVVKCRAYYSDINKDRRPTPEETACCIPYLQAQIKLINPKVIVALGQTATQLLLKDPSAITLLRGKWTTYQGIDLMPTYQPALLLRYPEYKGDTWSDLKSVMKHINR